MTPMRSIIVWILISFFSLCLCKFSPAEDNEKENDIIQTITRYQQIILENSDSIEARLSLGLAYFSHDLLEEATLAFHQVIELDSKSREGNYWLGRTYQSQKIPNLDCLTFNCINIKKQKNPFYDRYI